MKPLNCLLAATLLTGCNNLPQDVGTDQSPVLQVEPPPAAEQQQQPELAQPSEETHYLPVADWLVQRGSVCEQDREVIDTQLGRYRDGIDGQTPPDPDEQLVQAYTQLKALMLASCDPERTPGLLNRFLSMVRQHDYWPAEYSALFDLLESEYQAYALLEERYRDLQERHQRTIDGIGNIERSLESDGQNSAQ